MGEGRVTERWLLVSGSLLLAASPFVPWVDVVLLGHLTLLQLFAAAKENPAPAFVLTAIGVAIVLTELIARNPKASRITALTLGTLTSLVGGDLVLNLIHAVSQTNGLAGVSAGPMVMGAGCALVVIPALVGLVRRPNITNADPSAAPARRPVPAWLPLVVAAPACLGLALLPLDASSGDSCGIAASVVLRSPLPPPDSNPPSDVQKQLQADQAAVASASTAADAQQQQDQAAQSAAGQANNLSSQASNADAAAQQAADQVTNDQSTVQNDQSAVQNDQSQLSTDQQQLQSDQANGYDTTYDQTQIQNDQSTLANDQSTLANDQAALSKDQATAAQFQQQAATLDGQATAAQGSADSASQQASIGDQNTQQQLDQAQQQLSTDQQAWDQQYNAAVQNVQQNNAVLSNCRGQANPRIVAAALLALLGLAGSLSMSVLRRPTT